MKQSADYWIEKLGLEAHPEGGYFKEMYRSKGVIAKDSLPNHKGNRCYSTAIYFLLKSGERSVFHRLTSDEVWHFHTGSSAKIWMLKEGEALRSETVGSNLEEGANFQVLIPHNTWFAAEVIEEDSYILVGCTVAPGFDFADFEMAERAYLLEQFPAEEDLIVKFT